MEDNSKELNEYPIRHRSVVFIISILDFLLAILMLSVWTFQIFPIPIINDNLVDYFGIYGVVWFFLLYSLQLIMAVILCDGTRKTHSPAVSNEKLRRWLKGSGLIFIILFLNTIILESTFGVSPETLPTLNLVITQILFRIFVVVYLILSNLQLIIFSCLEKYFKWANSKSIDEARANYAKRLNLNFHKHEFIPVYPDLPPNYEEATGKDVFSSWDSDDE